MADMRLWIGSVGLILVLCPPVLTQVTLNHLNTQFLPSSYNPDVYTYNGNSVEKGAVDKNANIIYAVGLNYIHVINFDNPSAMENVYHVTTDAGLGLTDVTTCGSWVAVSAGNSANVQNGKVFVYTAYTPVSGMILLHEITVGTTPDMLLFTSDCKKILVAIEGSFNYDIVGDPFDAEGEVVTIIFNTDPTDVYAIVRSDFTSFNSRADFYTAQGVRWVYRGEGMAEPNTFSQDLEPEYISLSEDESVAYIMLQENNAVATMDMTSYTITEIYPLGVKSWASSRLDPSDQDGGIQIAPWDIYGAYMPDAFRVAVYNGQRYLVTANEGDAKEHTGLVTWTETQRGQDFVANNQIGPTVPIGLAQSLNDDAQLGRIDLSLVDYKNPDGTYSDFLSYGGRSFSLFRANSSSISLHWDSGSEFEEEIAIQHSLIFNGNANTGTDVASDTMDGRSDNSGPEPHALELGDVNGKSLVFIGLKRPGLIVVYSVNPVTATPQFESIKYSCGTGSTWEDMYNARTCWDLNPEGFRFIPASKSPTGVALLTCFSTITSTVSMYEVLDTAAEASEGVNIAHQEDPAPMPIDGGLTVGAIVGIACACAAVVMIIGAGAIYFRRGKRPNETKNTSVPYERHV